MQLENLYPSEFDGWPIKFSEVHQFVEELEAEGLALADACTWRIWQVYNTFVEETQYQQWHNLSMHRMGPQYPELFDAQDVQMGAGRNYLLFSCPTTAAKTALVF
ncbi:MAG: hypothetical protein JSR46_11420, partial [Verrucomicrobia bacterium]|nr:hypothetical protein [Verrucomicrobiota bacterium]